MAKHMKKETKKKNIMIILFQLVFIIVLLYSVCQIVIWYTNNRKNENIMQEISKSIVIDTGSNNEISEEGYDIDFTSLKKINEDTVAFLKVNGTDVEYPVVKGTDNDFYLNHSFDKTYNSAGWVFADYRNKFDGTDKNIIIYGHNRRDGSMFYTLKNILNDDWYENKENLKVKFITENQEAIGTVFSVYQIESEAYYLQTTFKNDKEYEEFLETITKRSKKNFKVDVSIQDSILTLSTCANNNKYRVVLHAKIEQ